MQTTFLDYYKTILDKVSFDKTLFTKEYQKALNILKDDEAGNLNTWLKSRGLQSILVDQGKKSNQRSLKKIVRK